MKLQNIKMTIIITLLLSSSFLISLYTGKEVKSAIPNPFFTITLLGPMSSTPRATFAMIISEVLPKIGIGVDLVLTGWAQITPRTWSHPGPYPIPPYPEGGYDILFVGWSWGLDFDPTGLYDTPSITPFGDNFYQYSSQEMDWAIANYTSSFVLDDRIYWAEKIQEILYEDLPQTTIIYPLSLYPHATDFKGWDGLLWASSYQNMANWSIGSETEFHYATPADFVDFHPYTYESVYDAQWLSQIYDGLLERDPLNHRGYSPKIASSISTTDGLTYSIELAPNVQWADGTALNTSDVEFSFINYYEDISNVVYSPPIIDNNSINVINATHMEITFLRSILFPENYLAIDIIPKHVWESIASENIAAQAEMWALTNPTKLMGSGSYYLAEYNGTNEVIHLTVNPYYDDWTGITPNFDDIYFEFYSNKEGALSDLASGTLDMVDAQFIPQIDEVPTGTSYTLVEDPGTQEMAFNNLHPIIGTGELCPISSPESALDIFEKLLVT